LAPQCLGTAIEGLRVHHRRSDDDGSYRQSMTIYSAGRRSGQARASAPEVGVLRKLAGLNFLTVFEPP